jgi:hypothetical protein
MAGTSYICEYQTEKAGSSSFNWTIEIIDEDASTNQNIEFFTDSRGVVFEYNGNSKDRLTGIIPSVCRFGMYIQSSAHENFITLLAQGDEKRFYVKVSRDYTEYWVGSVIVDGISIEDMPYPYIFEVTATDGIGLLKDVPVDKNELYITDDTIMTFKDILLNAVNELPQVNHFNSSDPILKTVVNWFDSRHPSTSIDPMEYLGVSLQHFQTDLEELDNEFEKGGYNPDNNKDIYFALQELCDALNARFYYSGGGTLFLSK